MAMSLSIIQINMANEQISFEVLALKCRSAFKQLEFSVANCKHYDSQIRKLKIYMNEQGHSFYNESVGNEFLRFIIKENVLSDYMLEVLERTILFINRVMRNEPYCAKKSSRTYPMPGKIGELAKVFIEKMLQEIRPSERTIYQYQNALCKFSISMDINHIVPEVLNEQTILSFVSTATNSQCYMIFPVRRFLRFMYENRYIKSDLSQLLVGFKGHRGEKIPSMYAKDEVLKIEQAVERTSAVGKRDYAMILLASRLGLRASDIRILQFSYIDWDKNKISLCQFKTKEKIELPLLSDVGEAIIDYIKYGRPINGLKTVFLTATHPYRQLTTAGLSSIVSNYIYRAGIEYKGRHHGTHCLRHSLATRLLQNGTALPVISEALGHTDTQSTMVYLSVDIKSLLQCSLEVPLVQTDFYEQKGGALYE